MYNPAMSRLPIQERFVSIQGEGLYTGTPSSFIRVSGCNLRCAWCDTPDSSWNPSGVSTDLDELEAFCGQPAERANDQLRAGLQACLVDRVQVAVDQGHQLLAGAGVAVAQACEQVVDRWSGAGGHGGSLAKKSRTTGKRPTMRAPWPMTC